MSSMVKLGFLAITIIILCGCETSDAANIITATQEATTAATLTPSLTATATEKPTSTKTITNTPSLTATPTITMPVTTPSYLGTPIPGNSEIINGENYMLLGQTAQWGKGIPLGVAFTPDGSKFVIGTSYGLAVYDFNKLESPPAWIPFDEPVFYNGLFFSEDGNFIHLGRKLIKHFPEEVIIEKLPPIKWLEPHAQSVGWGDIDLTSPDGSMKLIAYPSHDEENWDFEYSNREMYDTATGELLYKLPDETFYVYYNDIHLPEGCDISSVGFCGNAYIPSAFHPYEAAYSPKGDSLAILYRAPNYGDTNRFSIMRVYDTQNGTYIARTGNLDKPIQTFAYSPDSKGLLIVYVDGTVKLWDFRKNETDFSAWHLNDELWGGEYTSDGRFLLLRRPNLIEVRSTKDGSLRSRIDAVTYTLSPVDSNIIALADEENNIKLMEIDSGNTILSFPAHDFKIYSIAISQDGRYIATSGQDCNIKLWDANTGKFLHYFENTWANAYEGGPAIDDPEAYGNSRVFIKYLQFIEGTNQIVGFGSWGTMVNWNVNSGATNYVIYSAPLEYYQGMMTLNPHFPESFSVDIVSNQFYIGDTIYDLKTGDEIGKNQEPINSPENCVPYGPITNDNNIKFTIGYDKREGQVCILDTNDNNLIRAITIIPDPSWDLSIAGLLISPDGRQLIVATTAGTIHIFQITN